MDKYATTTGGKPKLMIPKWRMKKEIPQCNHNGKTWYWCPHHKKEGLFDGLYMPHKSEDHDICRAKKYPNKKPHGANTTSSTENSTSTKLQLTESMHNALVTEGNMTPGQDTALWAIM